MEQIIYIYNEKLELIGQPFVKDIDEFWKEPTLYFPSWKGEYYATLEKYSNPIIDVISGNIREKTREELILLNNQIELLQNGEYVEARKIIVVEAPERLMKKVWDKEEHAWVEGATKEEIIEARKNKILEYSKLEEEKKNLESSKFITKEEIEFIVNKLEQLEEEINNLAQTEIKLLGGNYK